MKIAIAQLKYRVGDIEYNKKKILQYFKKAKKDKADLIIFSELAITGYPPKDLILQKSFLKKVGEALDEIAEQTLKSETSVLFGTPFLLPKKEVEGIKRAEILYNSVALVEKGFIKEIVHKTTLSKCGDFNECLYFESAMSLKTVKIKNKIFAILLSHDMWSLKNLFLLKDRIFDGVIVVGASYFEEEKQKERFKVASKMVKFLRKPLIFVNQIGGQDSLIFDGDSFVLNKDGEYSWRLKEFEEDYELITTKDKETLTFEKKKVREETERLDKIYNAIVLGLRDYLEKCEIKKIIAPVSGGIDSSLSCLIAVDAVGKDNVDSVFMPSRFSSEQSMKDAKQLAENLKIDLKIVSIEPMFQSFIKNLKDAFFYKKFDLAEENIQARIRSNILMYFANKCTGMLLTTGNKSESAVGYSTLYGDTSGGFAVLGDVYKTDIYRLAKWRNENIPKNSLCKGKKLIPQSIFNKEPSAELREGQKDSDSIPKYYILDEILKLIIERRKTKEELIEMGYKKGLIDKIYRLFKKSEFKRRQEPLSAKISRATFGIDLNYPIC